MFNTFKLFCLIYFANKNIFYAREKYMTGEKFISLNSSKRFKISGAKKKRKAMSNKYYFLC